VCQSMRERPAHSQGEAFKDSALAFALLGPGSGFPEHNPPPPPPSRDGFAPPLKSRATQTLWQSPALVPTPSRAVLLHICFMSCTLHTKILCS
jgi:hypothetical protein